MIDVNGGFYFYENALPISRIRKIFFERAAQVQRTIANITLSTAFIPMNLVDNKDNSFDVVNVEDICVPDNLVSLTNLVKTKYEKYNRVLGALALMRIAHEEGCNFSCHYIDVLTKFNSLIECQKKQVSDIDTKFHGVFDKHPAFLDQTIDYATLEKEARENKQEIRRHNITKVINPSNLEKSVYLCYVLFDYGVGEESHRHKIDELILNNFSSLKSGYEESCALYYGYNRGYAAFNNQYKKEGKSENVKFQLNSLLDYYTIESIFEYCFNNVVSGEIKFFDSWITPIAERKPNKGEYIILDTFVRDKKKAILFSEDWWKNCFAYFIPKDKIIFNFMGYDASSIIIESLLKPFARFIKDEISSEYEETIQNIKDRNTDVVNCLENDLKKCRDEMVRQKMLESTHSSPKNDEGITPRLDNQGMLSFDEIELAKKVISLCSLKQKELKNLAKQKGCTVTRQSKMEDLVLAILRAEKQPDNKLFNNGGDI